MHRQRKSALLQRLGRPEDHQLEVFFVFRARDPLDRLTHMIEALVWIAERTDRSEDNELLVERQVEKVAARQPVDGPEQRQIQTVGDHVDLAVMEQPTLPGGSRQPSRRCD